jgi:hypothetical protein
MTQLWKRFADAVAWRWTLPEKFKAAQVSMVKERLRWQTRCEKAERSETALRVELKDALAECAKTEARCDALEDGLTASGLSAAEVERLALLAMAAGKLAAESAKVILYGWSSRSPGARRPAYVDVERGLGRVQALCALMVDAGDVRGGDVRAHETRSRERVGEQMTRQG